MSDINEEVNSEFPSVVKDGDPTDVREQDNEEFLSELYESLKGAHEFIVSIVEEDKEPCKGCYRKALEAIETAGDIIAYQHATLSDFENVIDHLEGEIIDLEGRNEELREDLEGVKLSND